MTDTAGIEREDIQASPGSDWRVVGVDPAPKKPSVICYLKDGQLLFKKLKIHEVLRLMNGLQNEGRVLITWDAPLTGPPVLNYGEKEHNECYFYYRWIELYFSKYGVVKTPKGISTLGYAGCPHWAITKAATGLPLVGPYCRKSEELPFHHIDSKTRC